MTDVKLDDNLLAEAARFDPPFDILCSQPCVDIRFSISHVRIVKFKVLSRITGGRGWTSALITINFQPSLATCGTESISANIPYERFYVFSTGSIEYIDTDTYPGWFTLNTDAVNSHCI